MFGFEAEAGTDPVTLFFTQVRTRGIAVPTPTACAPYWPATQPLFASSSASADSTIRASGSRTWSTLENIRPRFSGSHSTLCTYFITVKRVRVFSRVSLKLAMVLLKCVCDFSRTPFLKRL